MKAISKKIRQTGVKLLSTVFILSTLQPNISFAADKGAASSSSSGDTLTQALLANKVDYCEKNFNDPEAIGSCRARINKAENTDTMCDKARDAIKDAEKDALEACRKSGMGSATSCVTKALECKEQAEDDFEEDSETGVMGFANTIQTLTGQQLDRSAMSSGGNCPQWGGKDYADRKESLDDKLKELKEDLAKQTEEIGKAKNEYSNETRRIQKEMDEEQAEFDKQKAALPLQQQEEMAAKQKEQAQMSENLETLAMKKIELAAKLNNAEYRMTAELLKYSTSAIQTECHMQAVTAKLKAKGAFNPNSVPGATPSPKKAANLGGGQIATGKTSNAAYAAAGKACVQSYQNARINTIKTGNAEQQMIRKEMEQTDSKLANLRVQLQTAQENYASTVQAQNAAQAKAEQQLQKKMQLAVQEMSTLATKLQDDLQAIAERQKNLTQAIASVNQSMSELTYSGKPKSGTEEAVATASATVGDQINIIDRYLDDPDYSKCNLTSKYTDPSRKPTSKSPSTRGGARNPKEAKDGATQ